MKLRLAVMAVSAGLLIGSSVSNAQTTIYPGGVSRRPYSPLSGKLTVSLHPSELVGSLDQMIGMSKLIVDGTISSVQPSIDRNTEIPGSVETHSLVSIRELLSGKLATGTQTIVLVQEGGNVGRWDVTVPDDPLVKQGERYILFLAEDMRKEPPKIFGVPRYWTIGAWSGKVKVHQNAKIEFLPRAVPGLHQYDNTDVSAFLAVVKERITALSPKKWDPNRTVRPPTGPPPPGFPRP